MQVLVEPPIVFCFDGGLNGLYGSLNRLYIISVFLSFANTATSTMRFKSGVMITKASPRGAGMESAFRSSASFYGRLFFMFFAALSGGTRLVNGHYHNRTQTVSPDWAPAEYNVTTQDEVGCTGRGVDGYMWRNVGWGSNINCELD